MRWPRRAEARALWDTLNLDLTPIEELLSDAPDRVRLPAAAGAG